MIFTEVTIEKKGGPFSAQDAAQLTKRANRFDCEIYFEAGSKKANAKSVMGVISMGLKNDMRITVIAKGSDEEDALEEMERLLSGGLTSLS